jgi:hypothetical protein
VLIDRRPGRTLEPQPGLADGIRLVDETDELLDERSVVGRLGGEQLDLDRDHERAAPITR